MASFDPGAFASGLVGPLRDAVQGNLPAFKEDVQAVVERVDGLEHAVQSTLLALATETNLERQQQLRDDLSLFLPARRDAIMSIVASRLASDAAATFDAILAVVVKAAIVAVKSFI